MAHSPYHRFVGPPAAVIPAGSIVDLARPVEAYAHLDPVFEQALGPHLVKARPVGLNRQLHLGHPAQPLSSAPAHRVKPAWTDQRRLSAVEEDRHPLLAAAPAVSL